MLNTRVVNKSDEQLLFELYVSTRADEISAWGWDGAQQAAFLQMQFQAQQRSYDLQFPGAEHRVVLLGGQPVGQILTWQGADELRLIDVALLPVWRGRGIGRELIRGLQDRADALSQPIHLSVRRDNPARRLYQRLGFHAVAGDEVYEVMVWTPGSRRDQ